MLLQTGIACLILLGHVQSHAARGIVAAGLGSYATELLFQAKGPPAPILAPESSRGRIPTSDWWSSLLWATNSFPMFPHPLAVQYAGSGLRIAYPGASITANQSAIFGSMVSGANDLIIGHAQVQTFPKPAVAGFSDWFVHLLFATNGHSLKLSFGHGSPFVHGLVAGGAPAVRFVKPPLIWSGDSASSALGVSVNGRNYGLFGPTGSKWSGLGTTTLECNSSPEKAHFSVAVLPDNTAQTLALFKRFAHSHLVDTRVEWHYDQASSTVETSFSVTTTNCEGTETGTLFALYPHQWRNTSTVLLPQFYNSVRGKMKLAEGRSFSTRMEFTGVLPAVPSVAPKLGEWRMSDLIAEEAKEQLGGIRDTYWEGKRMGRAAALLPIAEQYRLQESTDSILGSLRTRLEGWLSTVDPDGRQKSSGLFYHDARWGTLIGFPASYGSDTELNDHNFHYGYFIRAAAEVARRDPQWGTDEKWGAMVKLLIRDIASPERNDPLFPFLRCFDPYAGHSWASGHAKFGDGNNQESSSESMNAWYGIILWGEATGNQAIRNLGIYLFTTEMNAIQEYWFDVHGDNFPRSYSPAIVTMVWGGKGANGTWFTADPQLVHAINWLPIHGGSLYLGLYPNFADKNYRALVAEHHGDRFNNWADLIWMYRALNDPADAIRMLGAAGPRFKAEDGNPRANTVHWIYNLERLGRVERGVTADYPLYAVFRKANRRTHIAYNMHPQPRTITFSDGLKLEASHGFALKETAVVEETRSSP